MTARLFFSAITKFIFGVILIGVMIFLPAGSLDYANGWLFIGVLFVPMFIAGIVMMIKCPELLKSRLDAKEKHDEQALVVKLSGLMFILGFVIAGLDYRFGWCKLPDWASYASVALFLVGYALYAEVLCENAYLSRTIQVQENQKVIDTGLYSIVRHPMYSATVILFLTIPIVLGSVYAFFISRLPFYYRKAHKARGGIPHK